MRHVKLYNFYGDFMEIKPIAFIKTDFKEKFGIPRQSGRVKELVGEVIFEKEYSDCNAVRGLENFSHIWLIFDFSLNHKEGFSPTVRPPRLGGNEHIGVFASRSPFRPNNLGLSCVSLEKIEKKDGRISLTVKGADLLDGTPIFDIKPYIPYCDCVPDAKGSYAEEFSAYKLEVIIECEVPASFPKEKVETLKNCIAEDPRPSYQNDSERIYKMSFSDHNISFFVENSTTIIKNIEKL